MIAGGWRSALRDAESHTGHDRSHILQGMDSRVALGIACVMASTLPAQSIQVYSEFRRANPFGEIVAADREGEPREILSPLLARNCHATFHVVVEAPRDQVYYFYVEPYPENALEVTVYKEMFRRYGKEWIPDSLLQVSIPYMSQLPDKYHNLPSQTTESFLVDVWVPADAAVGRMKLDSHVNLGGRWTAYPMEVRISDVVAPGRQEPRGKLPLVTASSSDGILGPLKEYLCGVPDQGQVGGFGVRQIIRRNILENIALARKREDGYGKEALAKVMLRGLNMDRVAFCSAAELKSPLGPEWYLRGRDMLFKGKLEP